jgi:hypothetical protein
LESDTLPQTTVTAFLLFFESGKPFISDNLPPLNFRLNPLPVLYLEREKHPYGRLQIPTRRQPI